MKRGKKAQFFIIFAAILGILILAAASVINSAKSDNNLENFQIKCENYKNEVFEISKYAVKNDKSQEFSLIKEFSNSFVNYMNNSYNLTLCFLYGDSFTSTQVNFPGGEENKNGNNVQINCDKFIRTYSLTIDKSFNFLMVARKNSETYICE